MSGQIWDHLPAMIVHFEEEKVPMPRFADNQMADIVAYLHSGSGTSTDATQTSSGAKGGHASGRPACAVVDASPIGRRRSLSNLDPSGAIA